MRNLVFESNPELKRQYDEASTIHRQARRVYALAKEDSSYAKECCELTYKALDSTFRVILTFYDVSYDDCKDIKDLFKKVIDKTAIAASSGNDDFNKNLDIYFSGRIVQKVQKKSTLGKHQ